MPTAEVLSRARTLRRLAFVVTASLTLAWLRRFVLDDAYISFRYADNLVHGWGLVWNPGERVQGYTNFLWTLLMALPCRWGADPAAFSIAVGLALFAATLGLTYALVARVFGSSETALWSVLLLGTNATFSAYATGGMETQLQTCVVVAAAALVARARAADALRPLSAAALSLLAAVALMTRLDSAVLLGALAWPALPLLLRGPSPPRRRAAAAVALVAPAAIVVGAWLTWTRGYYGSILPNTFQAKLGVPGPFTVLAGLHYVALYLVVSGLAPLMPYGGWRLLRARRALRAEELALVTAVLAWSGYVAWVGGDFMEFRLMVPIAPFLFALVARCIVALAPGATTRWVLAGLVMSASAHHVVSGDVAQGPETIAGLAEHVRADAGWMRVGQVLGQGFGHDRRVVIATGAAGAIPYYSRLTTVDMLGLNDAWVARHGLLRPGAPPGHKRLAPMDYLVARRVHLVLGLPWVVPRDEVREAYPARLLLRRTLIAQTIAGDMGLPSGARAIEIPLDPRWQLVALYLTPSPLVDAAAARNGWRVLPLVP